MKLHKSAGGVLFTPKLDKIYLIHKLERDEWALPKGHLEEGESQVDAAKREIFEETGYRDFIIIGTAPADVVSYEFETDGKKEKKIVYYFAAVLLSDKQIITPEMQAEGLAGTWLSLADALSVIKIDNIKDSIRKIHGQIRNLTTLS